MCSRFSSYSINSISIDKSPLISINIELTSSYAKRKAKTLAYILAAHLLQSQSHEMIASETTSFAIIAELRFQLELLHDYCQERHK